MLLRTLLALAPVHRDRGIAALLDARDLSWMDAPADTPLWGFLKKEDVDLVLLSDAPGTPASEELVRSLRALPEPPAVVIFVEEEDASRRASLLAAGCAAVLNLRIPDRELRAALQSLVRRLRDDAELRLAARTRTTGDGFHDIVARSSAMADVLSLARRVAGSDSSILILGPTGAGKERLARAMHGASRRSGGPFVPLNCSAIPESLLEGELFGWEQGAFTGAHRARRGHFEMAHGGTIFLDEIGELPSHLQVKLLRVLEDRRVQRLGSERSQEVDVRIVAATNRDLDADVGAGRFRADLYFRLAVVTLDVPPLSRRREDIAPLVEEILEDVARSTGRAVAGVEPAAVAALEGYAWPGNVRELINVLERAVLLSAPGVIGPGALPRGLAREDGVSEPLRPAAHGGGAPEKGIREARREAVEAFEVRYLTHLLAHTGGRIDQAAELAGITTRALRVLMRRNRLDKKAFKRNASE